MKPFPNTEDIEWQREMYQRNCITKALNQIEIHDEDFILISDLDEIPGKKVLEKIKNNSLQNVESKRKNSIALAFKMIACFFKTTFYHIINRRDKEYKYLTKLKFIHCVLIKRYKAPLNFKMNLYYYYINYQKISELWPGLQCVQAKWLKIFTASEIRNFRKDPIQNVKSGWHFSYLGGKEKITYKIRNFAHQEFNVQEILSENYIEYCIENGYSIFDFYLNSKNKKRSFLKKEVTHLPEDMQKIVSPFKNLILS